VNLMAEANIAISTFTTSAVVVFVMQRLKSAKWFPLIEAGKTWLNRGISIGAAALGALAINYVWNPNSRTLVITVPTLAALGLAAWHWLNHYAMQEVIYQSAVSKNTGAPAAGQQIEQDPAGSQQIGGTAMKLGSKIAIVTALVAASFSLMGCSALQKAQDVEQALAGIIQIAEAEAPALPAKDAAILTQWTGLASTLDGQLKTCISAAGAGGTKSTFLACFNAFAAGVASPAELAALRVMSATSVGRAQLYVTAIILGVNTALDYFGGAAQTPPTISAEVRQPSRGELAQLRLRLETIGL
jgi:hypothetical protein